jgi:2-phospho-L-lactate transferase/gluconeogenesis factor (CofD/UPF0052 family)
MKDILIPPEPKSHVNVVLFSGGRGSTVLSKQLINNPRISLTLAINGYDDGASTGEVRRFLGDSLGPSDFRKNASRLAGELQSCSVGLIELLDLRFPVGCTVDEAIASFRTISGEPVCRDHEFQATLKGLLGDITENSRQALARKLFSFERELTRTGRPFSFSDCSLGNLVFSGCFLDRGRDFNAAIADYCGLLTLPTGLIENVTDGANAYLVALDHCNRILGSEAEIVDANKRNHIKDIYLIDQPLSEAERSWLTSAPLDGIRCFLEKRSKAVAPNPRVLERIAEADWIIYSPGTQHSSLFPSYLTPGIGAAVAHNLCAIKLLITNLQEDAEIPESSAVDLIDRAVYYLKEKNQRRIPTPCLVTHYLVNDPSKLDSDVPYIPLGPLDSLEDPRLVRIGSYEDGVTGRHNAAKIFTPFLETYLKRGYSQKIAVLLLNTSSLNKITQTMLEMLRSGISDLRVSLTVMYHSADSLEYTFAETLPFEIHNVATSGEVPEASFLRMIREKEFDYVILFESSGMYRGEDIVSLASQLAVGRVDAVWGSRRLSVKDINESYKLRYRNKLILGTISYIGSHLLSLTYLLLYGRYISDTLSAVRAIRASFMGADGIDLKRRFINQQILSLLLRNRADIVETPVQFFPISPEKVTRTSVWDGMQSLLMILWWRFKPIEGGKVAAGADLPLHDRAQAGQIFAE